MHMIDLSKIIFFFGMITFTAFGCDKEEVNSDPEELPITIVRGLSVCGDSCYLKDSWGKNAFFVINNQMEFESRFECRLGYELPDIDFSNKTLLAGSQLVGGICASILDQQVTKYANMKLIEYKINVKQGGFAEIGSAYYHALIPKISSDYNVKIEVNIEPFNTKN